MKLSASGAALALAASPALAQSARVVDGDTLKVDGVTYRLWGIDAPELAQPCADGWPAGKSCHRTLARPDWRTPRHLRTSDASIATAALSRCAVSMAATLGPTWWPMAMPGPSSDIAATTSRKNARRQRCGPAYMVTHASPRGSGAPRTAQRARLMQLLQALEGYRREYFLTVVPLERRIYDTANTVFPILPWAAWPALRPPARRGP